MSEIMESMKYEAPVLPTGTSAFRAAGREKSRKDEGGRRRGWPAEISGASARGHPIFLKTLLQEGIPSFSHRELEPM
jgi:hypothetical protein